MHTTMTSWRNALIDQQWPANLPFMVHPGTALVGASVHEAVTKGECHARAVSAFASAYPTSAATMIMDLSLEAEAFGAPVRFSEHEVPTVVGPAVRTQSEVEALRIPSLDSGRIPCFLEAARLASSMVSDKPVLGGCAGPFSLAGRLLDMTEIMTAIMLEPQTVHLLLKSCTEFLVKYASALKNAGCNGLIIAEPAAGVLSADSCDEFSSQYVKMIVEAVQDDSFLCVLHNCGNTDTLVDSMLSTNAQALHFGNRANMIDRLEKIKGPTLVLGNIDPVSVRNGTPQQVGESVRALLKSTARFNNFVLSTGCDTPPGVPLENVDAFFAAWQEHIDER